MPSNENGRKYSEQPRIPLHAYVMDTATITVTPKSDPRNISLVLASEKRLGKDHDK